MIKSGQGLYEKAIELGVIKMECHWQNLKTPIQEQWEGLAKSATEIKPMPWEWGDLPESKIILEEQSNDGLLFKIEASDYLRKKLTTLPRVADLLASSTWVPGCPVYSRVTGSLHGYYVGKTQCGGCCIDAGDGGIDVEPFDLVTCKEEDVKELQRARAIERWEITIKHSNTTTLATFLADNKVNNPM